MKLSTVFISFIPLCLPIALILVLIFLASGCGGGGGGPNPFAVESERVATAQFAVSMTFAPDGRLFYAEQYTGNIRLITADGELLTDPFATVSSLFPSFDWGLIGIAVDPEFETNHYLYVSYMEQVENEGDRRTARPVVLRYTEEGSRGVSPTVIAGDLPPTDVMHQFFDAVGNLQFGPDGFLYLTIGDYDIPELAQNLGSVQGKILRIDKTTGKAAPDNPFVGREGADPRVFAYGFRKAFDFTFHPGTGSMYVTDNGPVSCDELNIARAGANYGWPATYEFRYIDCAGGQETQPIYFFAREGMKPVEHLSVVNPRGLAFISGDTYPVLGDSLLVCEENTASMRRLVLGGNGDQVVEDDVVVPDCQLDVAVSPEGLIYYSNSTEIRRLQPVAQAEQ